jgi:hypothetical protein
MPHPRTIRASLAAACALAAALSGCRGGERPDGAGGPPAVDPASVAGRTALELWQLRPGVTLGDWRAAHPEDRVRGEDSLRMAAGFGEWCAVSRQDLRAGDRVVSRHAYFYPPAPAAEPAPPDSGPGLVLSCELGLLWSGTAVTDSGEGARVADSLRTQLTAVFGVPDTAGLRFFGSAFWRHRARFRRGDLAVAMGVEAPLLAAAEGPAARRAFVVAWLPISRLDASGTPPDAAAWNPPVAIGADSAARLSGLDPELWRPLAAVAARAPGAAPATLGPADSLVRPLGRWIAAARTLSPPRQAAALYAADLLFDEARCRYRLCEGSDSSGWAPLRPLGAEFSWSELGGLWVYRRSWLRQARALDRDSPLGQQILLLQLGHAFDFSGTCAEGAEGFRTVIENGERYLARIPDSPIAAEVHYLVAEGYRDVVALAAGVAGDYADASRYATGAGEAAVRALTHYDAAVRLGRGREVAAAAWRRAWWLRAGLTPRTVRFYCVYD